MSYENARNGIGKVFTSQILAIIAAVCTLIAGIMAALLIGAAAAESAGGAVASGVGAAILGIAATVIGIIAYILNLVGLNNAGKDSEQLKKAFTISIVSLIVAIVFGIIQGLASATWIKNLGDIVATVLGLLVTYNVLYGCAGLKSELTDKANKTWKMYMIVVILDIVIALLGVILGAIGVTTASAVVSLVIVIADFVFDIIAFFMYLSFLSLAKKTL